MSNENGRMIETNQYQSEVEDLYQYVQNELKDMVTLNEMTRAQLFQRVLGGDRSTIDEDCGYITTESVTIDRLYELWKRDPIARRIVNLWSTESWRKMPRLFDTEGEEVESDFEKTFEDVCRSINGTSWADGETVQTQFWSILLTADTLSGIGNYSAIVLGLDDGKSLKEAVDGWDEEEADEPVEPTKFVTNESGTKPTAKPKRTGKPLRLLYMRPYSHYRCKILSWEIDPAHPRYGQPKMYQIRSDDAQTGSIDVGQPVGTYDVHWTRVVHICPWSDESPTLADSKLLVTLNRLWDLKKVYGGGGEGFWQGALPGIKMEPINHEVQITPESVTDMRKSLEDYINRTKRFLASDSMKIGTISPSVVDPTPHINALVECVCIVEGVPTRVFRGSERGELASTQDQTSFDDRCETRQLTVIKPKVIAPVVDRLIELGVLPVPEKGGWKAEFPSLKEKTDTDIADLAGKITDALTKYIKGGLVEMITPLDYLVKIHKFDKDEVEEFLENAAQEAAKRESEMEDEQDGEEEAVVDPSKETSAPDAKEKASGSGKTPPQPKGTPGQTKTGGVKEAPTGNELTDNATGCGAGGGKGKPGFVPGNTCAKGSGRGGRGGKPAPPMKKKKSEGSKLSKIAEDLDFIKSQSKKFDVAGISIVGSWANPNKPVDSKGPLSSDIDIVIHPTRDAQGRSTDGAWDLGKKLSGLKSPSGREINFQVGEVSESFLKKKGGGYFTVVGKSEVMDESKKTSMKVNLIPTTNTFYRDEHGTVELDLTTNADKPLNKPFRTPGGPRKFGVYVKNDQGNVVLVRFGDPNMEIKRDDPARRSSFRARHGCDTDPGPKWKPKYWSCRMWEKGKSVSDMTGNISFQVTANAAKKSSGANCGIGPGGFQPGNKCAGGGKSSAGAKATPTMSKADAKFEELMKDKSPADAKAFRAARKDGINIPPAWTDVTYHGADKDIRAEGRDSKGRKQRAENPEYRARLSKENNARITKDLTPRMGEVRDKLRKEADGGSEEAKVLYLITETGFRIGGKGDGKAKTQAFGASTLMGDHVKVDGDKVTFDFPGKKGVRQQHTVNDPVIARMMAGAKPGEKVFNTRDTKIRDYWKNNHGGKKVHDIRHAVATERALSSLGGKIPPVPSTQRAKTKLMKDVATEVASVLGNNPTQALDTYIDPSIWDIIK